MRTKDFVTRGFVGILCACLFGVFAVGCGKSQEEEAASENITVEDEKNGPDLEQYFKDMGIQGVTVTGKICPFNEYYKGDPTYQKLTGEMEIWTSSGDVLALSSPVTYDGQTISECLVGGCTVLYEDIGERALKAGETQFYGYFDKMSPLDGSSDITERVMGTPLYIFYVADFPEAASVPSDTSTISAEQTHDSVSGGVRFMLIDDNTVKASINDPYMVQKAADLSQIQMKLFPDDMAREQHRGAFAFKMEFHGQGADGIACDVYPQICRIEELDDNNTATYEEEIPGPNGAPLVGPGAVDDKSINFVVEYRGIGDIIRNNPVYASYMDYEEFTNGETGLLGFETVKPDLSKTSVADAVDLSKFTDVYPEYIVIEEDFDKYMSYSKHGFVHGVGRYEGQILWAPRGNSEITKKAVLVGSVDEFGMANYHMAVVYDSHADLMRDYVGDGEVNLTLDYGMNNIETAEIRDDMLTGFLPEDGRDMWGTWNYEVDDNVLYWHYVPNFETHYRSEDAFSVPRICFENAGFGNSELNEELEEIIREVIDKGETEGEYTSNYYYDDMSQNVVNDTPATSSVKYKGYYYQ